MMSHVLKVKLRRTSLSCYCHFHIFHLTITVLHLSFYHLDTVRQHVKVKNLELLLCRKLLKSLNFQINYPSINLKKLCDLCDFTLDYFYYYLFNSGNLTYSTT